MYEFEGAVCYCWFKPPSQNLVHKILRKQFSGSKPDLVPLLGTGTCEQRRNCKHFYLPKNMLLKNSQLANEHLNWYLNYCLHTPD